CAPSDSFVESLGQPFPSSAAHRPAPPGAPMRIAIVGPTHPYKGGIAQYTTALAHQLAADGHDVRIESWAHQYPTLLYPGQQTVTEPELTPYPDVTRRLSWARPHSWVACGRRLRDADLVIL